LVMGNKRDELLLSELATSLRWLGLDEGKERDQHPQAGMPALLHVSKILN
jgi:hypothetical protein